jgi:hypothetical protein
MSSTQNNTNISLSLTETQHKFLYTNNIHTNEQENWFNSLEEVKLYILENSRLPLEDEKLGSWLREQMDKFFPKPPNARTTIWRDDNMVMSLINFRKDERYAQYFTSNHEVLFDGCPNMTLVISGTTIVASISKGGCSGDTDLVIPSFVTEIGNSAFSNCRNIDSVVIPDSVTRIGEKAFENCYCLLSVEIGNSVTSIGDLAFAGGLHNLFSLTLGNSVKTIGKSAFSDCGLTSIILPESLIEIGEQGFESCPLISIIIPDSVTTIGNYAFTRCRGLLSASLGKSVRFIGYGAFSNCTSLPSIIIPSSVTSLGQEAFRYCKSLRNVVLGKSSVKEITIDNANHPDIPTSVIIPTCYTTIRHLVFVECSSIEAYVILE